MKIKVPTFEDSLHVIGFLSIVGLLVLDPLGMVGGVVFAAEEATIQGAGDYESIANTLGMIFILAVLIEVGLAVIFDWRVFLRYAEGKGAKVPIAIFVSLIVVWVHGIDVPGEVVTAFHGKPASSGFIGYLISALIIAGGSASVNGIFTRLGWRNPALQTQKAEDERVKSNGRIWVTVDRTKSGTADGQPITFAIDDVPVGVLVPQEQIFGGTDGKQVQPGRRAVKATWTDSSGSPHSAGEEVNVTAGQPVGINMTLS